jgi:hypothetical protein
VAENTGRDRNIGAAPRARTDSAQVLRVYGLLRFARNDDVPASAATKQPDGQISKILSSPLHKNIPLSPSGKSLI